MAHKYLVVFLLPVPKGEHAELKEWINRHSGGDFKQAFFGSGVVAYLFSSSKPINEIVFDRGLLNGDSMLLVEIGDKFTVTGLRYAEDWLRRHSPGR